MKRKLRWLLASAVAMAPQGVRAGEESVYDFLWLDPDKAVYVLQNKIHKKERTFYMDAGYLTSLTGSFQDTTGVAVKAGYHFHEEWAVEAMYLGYSSTNNDNYRNVLLLNGGAPFIRRPVSTLGVGIVWSPFYGKINTFNKIVYFDWSFGGGVAQVKTSSNLTTVTDSNILTNTFRTENYTGAYAKSAFKFHLSQNWHLGIEWVGTYYKAPGPKNPKVDKLRSQNDLILQIGWSY